MKISIIYTTVLIAASLYFVKSASVITDTDDVKDTDAHVDTVDTKATESSVVTRNRRDTGQHFTEEILAQAMCQSYADQTGRWGRVNAVGRRCPTPWPASGVTCDSICGSVYLHVQDSQTAHETWSCISAYHVYYTRQPTNANGETTTATLGLKSTLEGCSQALCGPNFCCCFTA